MMAEKLCLSCGEIKAVESFCKRPANKDGLKGSCKSCESLRLRNWRKINVAKVSATRKRWYESNKEKVLANNDIWRANNNDKVNASERKRYAKNPGKKIAKCALWQKANPDKVAASCKKWEKENRSKRAANKRRKYYGDIQFRLKCILRSRLHDAINNKNKKGSAVALLGCSVDVAIKHIESKFMDGMNWENWGEWHIDHRKPLASFDLEDKSQLSEACHYTNLQPLWAIDNLRKGCRHV